MTATHLQFQCFRCSGQGCGYCGGSGRLTRPNTWDLRDYLARTGQEGKPVDVPRISWDVSANGN